MSVEVTPNAQGRIVIPPALRKRAKLDSEALVLGMNRRIEIWSSEVYEEFLQSQIDIAAGAMLNFRL